MVVDEFRINDCGTVSENVHSTTVTFRGIGNVISFKVTVVNGTVVTVIRHINSTTGFSCSIVNEVVIVYVNIVHTHPCKGSTCNSCMVVSEVVVVSMTTGSTGFPT